MPTPVAFISYGERDEDAAHRLHMEFMHHSANARLMQMYIPDAAQRQQALVAAISGADVVLMLHSARSEASEVLREQVDLALRVGKPIHVCALDEAGLAAWPPAVQTAPRHSFAEGSWEENTHALMTMLGVALVQFSDAPPAGVAWLVDKWRVKFYNVGTRAHGYGEFTLKEGGAASGTLNIAQGNLKIQIAITGVWELGGSRFTLNGHQVIRGTTLSLPYQFEADVAQVGASTFRAQTPQGDASVFQRAPSGAG